MCGCKCLSFLSEEELLEITELYFTSKIKKLCLEKKKRR